MLIFNDKEALAPHVDTRARGDRIIPFIKHHMPLQSKGSIVELLVGPSASAGAEDAVASLLRSVGIADVMPVRSKIPYRS